MLHRGARELLGDGQQDRGRVGPVLGLSQQIDRTDLTVDCVVGDDQHLGRTGQEADADPSEDLALGFGDVSVSRANHYVDRRDRGGAQRHGTDRLDAAEHIDLVVTCQVLVRHDGR